MMNLVCSRCGADCESAPVMAARIAKLEAELAEWKKKAHLLADKLMERDAECVAEHSHREAAETLLREIEFHPSMQSKCPFCFGFDAKGQGETPRKHRADCRFAAHFARYKD